MNTFDMILEEMFKSGQIPRSMMESQKNKTWVDRLADVLDARTQSVTQAKQQAKMLGTPLERQQLNFGPNPTEGPLATPAGIPSIKPQVPPASKFDKFANSLGNVADITGNQALSNAANLTSVAKSMIGTPAGEVNRYAPAKFGKFANKFANSLGNVADITGNQALSNAANLASVAKFMMK